MITEPDKYYNIRDLDIAFDNLYGWVAHRKNGDLYLKMHRVNSAVFKGSAQLDNILKIHRNFKAYPVDN